MQELIYHVRTEMRLSLEITGPDLTGGTRARAPQPACK